MDTVIIKIYGPRKFIIERRFLFLPEFTQRKYSDLSPTERDSINQNRPYLRHFTLHPPRHDDYLPHVELYETIADNHESLRYVLQLEFSVPKLLHWNSLQETTEADRDMVYSRLKSALASVGIFIEINHIAEARVAAIHFCKNVFLPKTMRLRELLKELEKTDINRTVDVTLKEHKNGGRVLSIYSGTIERVFYDKISDAMRPKNKRKDKSQIDREREIIERFKLEDHEVFRYEYRTKKTQTVMRDVSKALGRAYGPITFADLFTPGLFKKMTLGSWRILIQRPENRLALFGQKDDFSLLSHIVSEAKRRGVKAHSLNNALISYGLADAIGSYGAKEVHDILSGMVSKDHPERLTRKIETAAEFTRDIPYSNNIRFIDAALEGWVPITLDYLRNVI